MATTKRKLVHRDIALENLKGFVKKGSDIPEPEFISTGHFALDLAIAHGLTPDKVDLESPDIDLNNLGGLPLGKLAEIYGTEGSGKSSIAYRVVGFAQKLGYNCLWIDAENSFSRDLAHINGVNMEDLAVSELFDPDDPDKMFYAEDIMENICVACKSGFQVIVLDSVAALNTKAEMENAIGQGGVGMGALAQLMARAVKKVCNYSAKFNCLVIMINQIREKIGCFSGDTKVRLGSGKMATISQIVHGKSNNSVLTASQDGSIEEGLVVNRFDNGFAKAMLHFQVAGGKNGKRAFTCTENHRIFCPTGEIQAKHLSVGDEVLVLSKKLFSEDQMKLIFGSILGDGSLRYEKGSQRATLRLGHGIKQLEYCQWKAKSLSQSAFVRATDRACYWDSPRTEQFRLFSGVEKKKGITVIPERLIHEIDAKVTAIWYADDGTYSGSNRKWGHGKCEIAATKLDADTLRNLQIHFETAGMGRPSFKTGRGLLWSGEQSRLFQKAIAPYLLPSMRYKIKDTNEPFAWDVVMGDLAETLVPAPIIAIDKVGKKRRYDMEIAGTHSYFASDVLVHNCMFGDPESTPGGKALKFHASIRLRFQKQASKDGQILVADDDGKENLIAGKSYVQIKKNRFGKPVTESVLIPIYYERYFPDIEEILFDTGRQTKLISVRKGIFSWTSGTTTIKEEGRKAFLETVKREKLVAHLAEAIKAEAKALNVLLPPEVLQYEPPKGDDESQGKVSRRRKAKDSTGESDQPVEASGGTDA